MQLFGSYTSPYVRHCRIVLLETGLPCEFVESDAKTSAARSPTKKLPFLQDGEVLLTDSSSILRYLREQAGQRFSPSVRDYDLFCLTNTVLDAATNLFMLEKDGITADQSPYLQRQAARIDSGLTALDKCPLAEEPPYTDYELRLGCMLAWARFRGRVEVSDYPHLNAFLTEIDQYPHFAATAPHE